MISNVWKVNMCITVEFQPIGMAISSFVINSGIWQAISSRSPGVLTLCMHLRGNSVSLKAINGKEGVLLQTQCK